MKPTPSKPREVERVILRLGFVFLHQVGSHRTYYRQGDGRKVVIPFHPGDIKTGTLRNIIATAGITVEQFNRSV